MNKKQLNEMSIEDLMSLFIDNKLLYNTDEWVDAQSVLLSKMVKADDFSALSNLLRVSKDREHFRHIEFICSHLNVKWCNRLWHEIKLLITCKDATARYRGVWLYASLANEMSDYLSIINALFDDFQIVRLEAFDWVINESEIVLDIVNSNSVPNEFMDFIAIIQKLKNKPIDEVYLFFQKAHSSVERKAIFFSAVITHSSINELKKLVSILDDQDIFDYFSRYYIHKYG